MQDFEGASRLDLKPSEIQCFEDDDLGTNVLNCIVDGSYFCMQIGQYLESNPILNLHYFENGGQSEGCYADFYKIIVSDRHLEFIFYQDSPFLGRFHSVRIALLKAVDAPMVDFLVNAMFLGDKIEHRHGIDALEKIEQHIFRDRL